MNELGTDRNLSFTASYTIAETNGGYRFQFRCAFCESGYATELIKAESVDAALRIAEKSASRYFSSCAKCGKWVCDYHYNMQELACTECIPLSEDSDQLEFLRELGVLDKRI